MWWRWPCRGNPSIPPHMLTLARASAVTTLLCRSYVGVMHMEFLQYLAMHGVPVGPSVTTGNGMDFLIGRLSYTFGLTGPCIR